MNKKLLTGIVLGAAAGAILGILFAPDKGSETRKRIVKKGGEWGDAVKDKLSALGEKLSDKYEDIREDAEAFIKKERRSSTTEKAETFKDDVVNRFS
ncbi:MAG: YtxH domain-containing protein [Ferruginibacter sp.]|nr:YtxH domain-containing protein [Ferruginibacter sp.]